MLLSYLRTMNIHNQPDRVCRGLGTKLMGTNRSKTNENRVGRGLDTTFMGQFQTGVDWCIEMKIL